MIDNNKMPLTRLLIAGALIFGSASLCRCALPNSEQPVAPASGVRQQHGNGAVGRSIDVYQQQHRRAHDANKTSHEILSELGMARVHMSPSHHRKRLAVQSRRHHSRPDDSDMFVIKLPPNNYYYAHNVPHRNHITGDKKLPVGFRSNGKPGRIYHWNIPVLKKILSGPKRHASRSEDSPTFDIRHTPTWTNWENEVALNDASSMHYSRKKTPAYYAPAKSNNKKKSFMKMFPGNGKPRTFYVIEKSKKKSPHQMLLP